MTFNPGDVVRLKSGGPAMTVERIGIPAGRSEQHVFCVWFEKTAMKHGNFAPAALELDESGGGIAFGVA